MRVLKMAESALIPGCVRMTSLPSVTMAAISPARSGALASSEGLLLGGGVSADADGRASEGAGDAVGIAGEASAAEGRPDDDVPDTARGADVRAAAKDRRGRPHGAGPPAAEGAGRQGGLELRSLRRIELEVDRGRGQRQDLGMVMHEGRPRPQGAPEP